MTVNYTTLLGLAKPVTGTEAGDWGEIVNDEITTLLEDAVAATTTVDVTASGATLTLVDGQQSTGRSAVIKVIGTPGVTRNIEAPNRSKTYVVVNGSDAAIVFKASATTGVTINSGVKALVVWDGSDYVTVASSAAAGTVLSVTASAPLASSGGANPDISLTGTVGATNGGTGFSSYTTGQILYASSSTALTRLNIGSNGTVLTVVGGVPMWQSVTGTGTVTSVGFSSPNNAVFPVSGSPVTTTGTLTMGYSGARGSLLYASNTNTISNLSPGSTGQVLVLDSTPSPVWGSVGPTAGGTGQSNYNTGDILYASTTNTLSRRGIGSEGQVLTVVSGVPAWAAAGGSSTPQFTSLGVGTPASGVTGEIRATNNITAYYSDDRLKTRLGGIENALEKVKTLNGFYYEANDTAQSLGYDKVREVGLSAQEVQAVLPEVVVPAPIDDKYLTIRYERVIALLVEAVKELSAEVEALRSKQ